MTHFSGIYKHHSAKRRPLLPVGWENTVLLGGSNEVDGWEM
jgi:hypothetical protein